MDKRAGQIAIEKRAGAKALSSGLFYSVTAMLLLRYKVVIVGAIEITIANAKD